MSENQKTLASEKELLSYATYQIQYLNACFSLIGLCGYIYENWVFRKYLILFYQNGTSLKVRTAGLTDELKNILECAIYANSKLKADGVL